MAKCIAGAGGIALGVFDTCLFCREVSFADSNVAGMQIYIIGELGCMASLEILVLV